ncbi:MAG: hypothetical protein WCL06_04335 [Bacteroidota bacterium]
MANTNPKRLKCEYNKPGNISELCTYYLAFLAGMLTDPLFTAIATLLGDAKTQVQKLQSAEEKALTRVPGAAATRDTVLVATEIIMDKVLGKVQEAGDENMEQARIIFESHQLKVVDYGQHPRDTFEVKHGKVSKTFKVINKPVGKNAGYVWMISEDKKTWYLGDFGSAATGLIDSCNDQELVQGKLYYIKSRSNLKGVKSDWSQIMEKYCI